MARSKPMLIERWKDGLFESIEEEVVEEVPLTIYVNDREVVTLLSLGEYMEELAVGFLRSEGFFSSKEELTAVEVKDGIARVTTSRDTALVEKLMEKRTVTTGCGKGTSFYHPLDGLRVKEVTAKVTFSPEGILARMAELEGKSELYKRTGGTHNCSLATEEETLIFRSDIGRHNAVDMLGGRAFMDDASLDGVALFTSGRVSSEILLKCAKMGVAMLVSRSAPTSLALKIANEVGVTIVGYARGKKFNIYTHQERIAR
ncbi:MAG: formate dehydrogenase family accessory protein FdhD [Deltaproteobacteria bacterium]|nr:MAG: formate dehydrogenase family accessory protein FdhD [Deltaproteobacteria bacterium]